MNPKKTRYSPIVGLLILALIPLSNASAFDFVDEDALDLWTVSDDANGQLVPAPQSITFDLSTDATGGERFVQITSDRDDVDGLIATITVDALSADFAAVSLRKVIGSINGNPILVELWARADNGERRGIEFRIRERTPEGDTVQEMARGTFGNRSDNVPEWNLGEPVTLGLARVGTEAWFVMGGQKVLFKVDFLDAEQLPIFVPENHPLRIATMADAEGCAVQLSGTITALINVFVE